MSRRKRRILVAIVILGLLGVGSAGVYYVMRKGQVRQDPLVRGLRAEKAGNFEEAERLYRSLLESKPDHAQAFRLLVNLLQTQRKLDEMELVAKGRCESAPESADGWDALVRVAMMRGKFAEAERIARSRALDQPLLLQWTLWRIYDLSADPRRRLLAAQAALQYAELAGEPVPRANAELFAARTYRDLADAAREDLAESLRQRSRELVVRSEGRLKRSLQLQPTRWADTLLARAQLLNPSPKFQAAAAEKLRLFLAAHEDDPQAPSVVRELIDYRLRAGAELPARADAEDPAECREAYFEIAKKLAKPLAEMPAYQFLRDLRAFERSGAYAEALELLESRGEGDADPLLEVHRCQLLLRVSPERKAEVAERALALIASAPDWRIAVAAHDAARQAGEPDRALEAMIAYQEAHPNQQLALGLASMMASAGDEKGGVSELIEQGVPEEARSQLLGPILQILDRAGPPQVFAYLEKRIEEGAKNELQLRLARSLYVVRRLSRTDEEGVDSERRKDLTELARADLGRCAQLDDKVTPEVWFFAAKVSLALRSPDLAGGFVARMIRSMESELSRVYSLFRSVANTKEETLRDEFLAALSAGLEGTDDQQWVAALSAAVSKGKSEPADLLHAVLAAAPVAEANVRTLEFAAPLAMAVGRTDVAEQVARRLLEIDSEHIVGALVLGGVLFGQGKFEEVLATHAANGREPEKLSGAAHRQCAIALIRLNRLDEAEERARRYFEANPRDPDSYEVLARVLVAADKKREALGVLVSGAQTNATMTKRAQLLMQLDEPDAAEEILFSLVARTPGLVSAWSTLLELLRDQNRCEELIAPLTNAMEAVEKTGDEIVLHSLTVIRGMAREQSGQSSAALEDYIVGIQSGTWGILPLNNAAWLICQSDASRLDEAKRYIETALERDPENANVNDTAAHVYFAMKDYGKASERIEKAIAVHPEIPKYWLMRARILAAGGDSAKALSEIDRVLAANPSLEVQNDAKALRESLQGGKDD